MTRSPGRSPAFEETLRRPFSEVFFGEMGAGDKEVRLLGFFSAGWSFEAGAEAWIGGQRCCSGSSCR